MMPTLSTLMAHEVVVTTTYGTATDDKVGIMETLGLLCHNIRRYFVLFRFVVIKTYSR